MEKNMQRRALVSLATVVSVFVFSQPSIAQTRDRGLALACEAERSLYYQLADSADLQLAAGNWSAGERLIRQALSLEPANPGNTMLFSNLGVAQMQQGNYKEAVRSLDIALIRAPRSSTMLSNRAKAYLGLGMTEEALRDIDAVLAIDSVSEWALQTRALMRLSNGAERTEDNKEESPEWASDFATLRRHYPTNSWGWFGGGCEAEGEEDYETAERFWVKTIELEGEKKSEAEREVESEAAFRLAMLRLRRGELQQAGSLLREQLRRHPKDGKLLAALGWYHRASLLREESEADLRLAREYGAPQSLIEWIRSR